MLVLRDREIEELLVWFEHCYDVDVHPTTGRPFFKRVVLPSEGGIGDQDARLINGLVFLGELNQQVLDEQLREREREQKTRVR